MPTTHVPPLGTTQTASWLAIALRYHTSTPEVQASPRMKHKLLSARVSIKKTFPTIAEGGGADQRRTRKQCDILLSECVTRHSSAEFEALHADASRWQLVNKTDELPPPAPALTSPQNALSNILCCINSLYLLCFLSISMLCGAFGSLEALRGSSRGSRR